MTQLSHIARRRGFTYVELCMGLVVSSLVMAALAAFALATGTAWSKGQAAQGTALSVEQVNTRIEQYVRNARFLGASRTGTLNGSGSGAAILIWAKDTNGDGRVQGAEVAMIEHDTSNKVLRYYAAGQGNATTAWTWATFSAGTTIDGYKVGRTSSIIARDITGARFATSGLSGTDAKPRLDYTLVMSRVQATSGAMSQTKEITSQPGTATVRAPLPQPN